MNYYFLLEDEKSFIKVLPEWLKYMGIQNTRVQDITYVRENNYVMQSGQGVTQLITRVLFQTIDTILLNPGKIDQLIVILDSEEYMAAFGSASFIVEQFLQNGGEHMELLRLKEKEHKPDLLTG